MIKVTSHIETEAKILSTLPLCKHTHTLSIWNKAQYAFWLKAYPRLMKVMRAQ